MLCKKNAKNNVVEELILKTLGNKLSKIMSQAVEIVNYISIKVNLFERLCIYIDVKHKCLLLHIEVRCLLKR